MSVQPDDSTMCVAPVSIGELVDKITILSLKQEYISDPEKLANIARELGALRAALPAPSANASALSDLTSELLSVNRSLWHIEDEIRDCERLKNFGARFIELARSVYLTNDRRAEIKRQISSITGSALLEEKSYQNY